MRTTAERLRNPGMRVPPPRPARRHPTLENRPTAQPVEEREEQYFDQEDGREAVDSNQASAGRKNGERTIFRIHQAFYPVGVAYFASTVATAIIAALFAWLRLDFRIALIPAIIFYIPAIFRHIKLLNTIYILTETKFSIESGFFSKTSRNIPLRHIQDVFVSETLKERLIGIGDINIDTAATEGTLTVDNIKDPRIYADMILDQLHRWN
jgi:membrane protein YdbS with pleckstrin-like domain